MAGLDKGKHPIRPGLSSSTFIPPTLDPAHHVSISTSQPLAVSWLWDRAHCSSRPRHGHHHLRVAEKVIPLYLRPWQQTDSLVNPLEAQAPGRGLQRSSDRVGGETDPEAEPDRVKGSCAVSAVRLK